MKLFHFLKKQEGFSLAEVIVSISILLLGVVPLVAIITKSLHNIQTTKNKVIAANLAQEGIELTRAFRDDNRTPSSITCSAYKNGFPAFGSLVLYYCPDYTRVPSATPSYPTLNSTACTSNGLPLCIQSTGTYTHNCGAGTTSTPFRRRVYVQLRDNPHESTPNVNDIINVISQVTWTGNWNDASTMVSAQTQLYNWPVRSCTP